MAMINGHKCGKPVSTEAAACPKCGAPPLVTKSRARARVTSLGTIGVVLALIVLLAMCSHTDSNQNKSGNTPAQKPPVDYARPLQTEKGALVCPFAAAFDNREGRGLQAAMRSRNTIFGRQEKAEKAGCNEWQQGIAIILSDDERKKARRWQAEGSCGMLEFPQGFVFSCDLENSPSSSPDISAKPAQKANAEAAKVSDEINSFNSMADKMYAEASTEDKKLLDFFKFEKEWVSPAYFCGSSGCDEQSEKYEQNLKTNGWSFVYARDQKSSRIKPDDAAFTYGRWMKM
jgi:hypothetical protein